MQFDVKTDRKAFKKTVPRGKGGIYFLYDKDWNLLYIGKAADLRNRIDSYIDGKTHIWTQPTRDKFLSFYHIYIIFLDEEIDRRNTELKYIREHSPLCNTTGSSRKIPSSNRKLVPVSGVAYNRLQNLINEINETYDSDFRMDSVVEKAIMSITSDLEKALKKEKLKNQNILSKII